MKKKMNGIFAGICVIEVSQKSEVPNVEQPTAGTISRFLLIFSEKRKNNKCFHWIPYLLVTIQASPKPA